MNFGSYRLLKDEAKKMRRTFECNVRFLRSYKYNFSLRPLPFLCPSVECAHAYAHVYRMSALFSRCERPRTRTG
jgi:hypothetical protein